MRNWCTFYSTFRNQYIFSQVLTLNSELRTFVCINRPCWTTQPTCSKWLKMKPLNGGFQQCIDFELSMSIRVVVDIYCFGGYVWVTPQNKVLIFTVPVDSRTPWCPTQPTRSKWLKMKPLNRGFQRYIKLELSVKYWDWIRGTRCLVLAIIRSVHFLWVPM